MPVIRLSWGTCGDALTLELVVCALGAEEVRAEAEQAQAAAARAFARAKGGVSTVPHDPEEAERIWRRTLGRARRKIRRERRSAKRRRARQRRSGSSQAVAAAAA